MLFFGQKLRVGRTGGRTDRRTDAFPCTNAVLFSSLSCQSYYVTFVWSCNIALWGISLDFVERRICVVIRLADQHATTLSHRLTHHTDSVQQCCTSDTTMEISPLAASETFTQKVWRIGAGSLHS